jgi:hypothetical protein
VKTVVNARRHSGKLKRLVKSLKLYLLPANIFTREDRQFRLNWWQILCVVTLAFLVFQALDHAGRLELGRQVLASLGSLFIAIKLRWRL